MELDSLAVLCSFGVIALSAIWIRTKMGTRAQLPHYRGWPVVGNLFQVRRERPELTFIEWAKDLGPVFSMKMFHQELVILSSFDAIYEALVKKGDSFSERPQNSSFRLGLISDNFLNIASSPANSTWRKLKKVCHKKIKMYDTGMKQIEDISTGMIRNLLEVFESTTQKSFNPKEAIYNTVMNTITSLALGRIFSTEDELFKKLVQFDQGMSTAFAITGRGAELDIFPWLRFFRKKSYKVIQDLVELRNQIWELIKEETSQEGQLLQGDEEDVRLVSALREALVEEGCEFTEEHLRAVATIDVVFAGTATTSHTLCIYLNVISKHPNIQAKLQEEVDTIVGSERMVSLADKGDMPYTQATLLELLRYSSVAPLGGAHMPLEDTVVQGKTIPAGSTVLINYYHLHHDEEFWKNPFEFEPERFLDEDGCLVSASHPNRRHLMPFGAGPRVCLGEVLAKTRIFLIIASLAQKFEILPGDISAPSDPRQLEHGALLASAEFEIIAKERIQNT
ncbi:hypothetical protein CAPTEDRAFT_99614 [Capitella teleta]|uniref:Cytochrome P450 n=1 Tax=Capitella teleta TaxID=283909 RepID=R7TS32_CAPTE|nr:hypothetical protein CAPTEDRAFT_99614 [Capitella teleta]|eukprot:ELT93815.1 hypothetical protein CAPTEDRAFT_99614 [Capitella teleta]